MTQTKASKLHTPHQGSTKVVSAQLPWTERLYTFVKKGLRKDASFFHYRHEAKNFDTAHQLHKANARGYYFNNF